MRMPDSIKEVVAVLSMIRAELYRIAKSPILRVFAIVFFLFVIATPLAIWLDRVWPDFAALGIIELPNDPLPALQFYGSFVSGSFIAMGVGILMANVVAEDFKSGSIKNLIQARGGRTSYVIAAIACTIALAAVATAAGAAVIEIALRIQGYIPIEPSFGELLQWFMQVTLCIAAYTAIAVLVAILTTSETAATLVAIMLGGGAIESILQFVLANIPGLPSFARDCLDGYLAADMGTLGQGMVCDPMTYAQAIATIAVATALAIVVMRRKNLG